MMRKPILWSVWLLPCWATMLLSGCAPALFVAGAAGGYYVARDKSAGPVYFVKDSAITAAIKTKLLGESTLSALRVHVDTVNAEVTLSGTVDNERQKQLAIDLARETLGVKKVIVKLDVRD